MATHKSLMTQMDYDKVMNRFVIRVNADVEKTVPSGILDSVYKGLRGRALKLEIYRKAFELVNAQTLTPESLERYFTMDNRDG